MRAPHGALTVDFSARDEQAGLCQRVNLLALPLAVHLVLPAVVLVVLLLVVLVFHCLLVVRRRICRQLRRLQLRVMVVVHQVVLLHLVQRHPIYRLVLPTPVPLRLQLYNLAVLQRGMRSMRAGVMLAMLHRRNLHSGQPAPTRFL